jgi:hypothetical protein
MLKRARLGYFLNDRFSTSVNGSAQTLSSLELLNLLNQFVDGALQYQPYAQAVRDAAELEKVDKLS